MPIPNSSFYTGNLAAYGTNGATPGQASQNFKSSQEQDSVADVTLTGTIQGLATLNPTTVAGEHIIITTAVAAVFSGSGTAQLDAQLIVDGVVVAEGNNESNSQGATVTLVHRVSPAAGLHAISVAAKATGDATLTVFTGDAQLVIERVLT